MTDSVESVLSLAEGLLIVDIIGGEPMNFSQSFPARTVELVLKKLSREVSRSTIRLVPARLVLGWDTRWNLMRI